MSTRQKSANPLVRIFAVPAAIALASLVGLIAALLGDGAFDVVSWLALGVPLVVVAWAMRKRTH